MNTCPPMDECACGNNCSTGKTLGMHGEIVALFSLGYHYFEAFL